MNPDAQLHTLEKSLDLLLGPAPLGDAARRDLADCRREVAEITEGRGLRSVVIAVVGPKNSGKSWLCRSLLTQQEDRARIASGLELQYGTDRLCWVGEETPAMLDPELEQAVPVAAGGLVDLGVAYTLLDMPGYDEADAARRGKALRSVTLAPLRVTMFSWDTLAATADDAFLAEGNGVTLLPVVTDPVHPRGGLPEEVRHMLERLRRRCPQSLVLDPVLIPRCEFHPERAAVETSAAAAVHAALRQALANLPEAGQAMVVASQARLRRRLGDRLAPWLTRLREPLERLDTASERLTQEVFTQLVGDSEELARSLRFRLVWQSAEALWGWMVPFRGLLRLLALLGGRVDRLGLAMLGSAPSLARAAFEAVRQARGQSRRLTVLEQQLQQRVRRLIAEHLQPARRGFFKALQLVLPGVPAAPVREPLAGIDILGLDTLRMKSLEVFRQQVEQHAERRLTRLLGLAGTLIFLLLAAGPIVALGQSFALAWNASFAGLSAGLDPSAWRHYPMPPAGFFFVNLALVLLPVVGLAGLAGWISAGRQRRQRCAEAIGRAHQKIIRELAEQGGLGIARRDATVEAARVLLDFVDGKSLAAADGSESSVPAKDKVSQHPDHD